MGERNIQGIKSHVQHKMERQSNFELLRLVLMFFVLMLHCVAYIDYSGYDTGWVGNFIVSFVHCAVPVFLILSGYFGITLKFKKVANLYLLCFFYGLAGYLLHIIIDDSRIGRSLLFESVFSISHGWWFISNYFMLCLISPLINIAVNKLSRKQFFAIIIMFTIVNVYFGWFWGLDHNKTGYEFSNFIYMYLIGRFLGIYYNNGNLFYKYIFGESKGDSRVRRLATYGLLYFVCCFLMFVFDYMFGEHYLLFNIHKYNYPLVILASMFLLLSFANIRLNSKWINYLSSSSLAVYLIHCDHYINGYMVKWIHFLWQYSPEIIALKWMIIIFDAFVILICCVFIDKIRMYIMKPLNRPIDLLDRKIDVYISTLSRS